MTYIFALLNLLDSLLIKVSRVPLVGSLIPDQFDTIVSTTENTSVMDAVNPIDVLLDFFLVKFLFQSDDVGAFDNIIIVCHGWSSDDGRQKSEEELQIMHLEREECDEDDD